MSKKGLGRGIGALIPGIDPAERERLYHEALRKIHEDAAHLIDWRQKDVYATSTRIHWLPRSDEEINLFSATWAG